MTFLVPWNSLPGKPRSLDVGVPGMFDGRRTHITREVDDVADGGGTKKASCFVDLVRILFRDRQWERAETFRAGDNDVGHAAGVLAVPRYPHRGGMFTVVLNVCSFVVNQLRHHV